MNKSSNSLLESGQVLDLVAEHFKHKQGQVKHMNLELELICTCIKTDKMIIIFPV